MRFTNMQVFWRVEFHQHGWRLTWGGCRKALVPALVSLVGVWKSIVVVGVAMRNLGALVLVAVVVLSGCISLPEVEQVSETPDASEPDAHVADSGALPDASTSDSGTPDSGTAPLTVTLVMSKSVTNSDVQVSGQVTGTTPDEVELLVDGVAVATLAPPYELRWSAQALDEGSHVLSLRASLGGRRFTSELRTLIVDRTPPRLVTQSPQAGAQYVSVHQAIQATFSEPVDPTSVSAESVKLLSDAGVMDAEVVLAPEGTSLTLRPSTPLSTNTALEVRLGSLTDLAGNTLQALPQDWQWTIPSYLPLGDSPSTTTVERSVLCPSSQLDGEGRPVVAWLDGTQVVPATIHVKRWNESRWEPFGSALNITPGHGNSFCALEVDKNGYPIVAWDEYSSADGRRLYVRRWNGAAWESVGNPGVLLRPQANSSYFTLKGNKNGQLALAFVDIYQGNTQVVVGRWSGSEWSSLGEPLKGNASWLFSPPVLGLDVAGNPIVLWNESSSSTNNVYMRRWNGSAWEVIPWPGQMYTYPKGIVFDGAGVPLFDMYSYDGVASSAQVQRWNGSSWVPLGGAINNFPGATSSLVTSFSFDSQRRLTVLVAEPEVAGQATVSYVRRWNGGTWEPLGSFLRKNPGWVPVGLPLHVMDSSDRPVVAMVEESEAEPRGQAVHVYTPND